MNYLEIFGPHLMTIGVVAELHHFGELGISDVVEVELARIKAGAASAEEEEIGLLLSDDYERGHLILESEFEQNLPSEIERETLLIADLIRIRNSWTELDDPPSEVEAALEAHALDERYGGLRLLAPMRRSEKTPKKYMERVEGAISTGLTRLRGISKQREAGAAE